MATWDEKEAEQREWVQSWAGWDQLPLEVEYDPGFNALHYELGGGGKYSRPQFVWDRPGMGYGVPERFWDPADVEPLVASYGPDWNDPNPGHEWD